VTRPSIGAVTRPSVGAVTRPSVGAVTRPSVGDSRLSRRADDVFGSIGF